VNSVQKRAEPESQPVGNESSAESLVDALTRLYPRMHSRALFLTQEPHAADDLVQQVCERALRAQASFKRGSDAAAWLYRVMRNLFIDERRSRRHIVELVEEPAAAPGEQLAAHDLLTLDDVRQAMTSLRPHDRQILDLAYFQRCSYREIAQHMRLKERTTGTRLFRARAKLKQPLGVIYERRVADLRREGGDCRRVPGERPDSPVPAKSVLARLLPPSREPRTEPDRAGAPAIVLGVSSVSQPTSARPST
jgi:RNA polymerase sigma-70 factor (ECF subfamily)